MASSVILDLEGHCRIARQILKTKGQLSKQLGQQRQQAAAVETQTSDDAGDTAGEADDQEQKEQERAAVGHGMRSSVTRSDRRGRGDYAHVLLPPGRGGSLVARDADGGVEGRTDKVQRVAADVGSSHLEAGG